MLEKAAKYTVLFSFMLGLGLFAVNFLETSYKYRQNIEENTQFIYHKCRDPLSLEQYSLLREGCSKAQSLINVSFSDYMSKYYLSIITDFSLHIASIQPVTSDIAKSIIFWGIMVVIPALCAWFIHRYYDYKKAKVALQAGHEKNQLKKAELEIFNAWVNGRNVYKRPRISYPKITPIVEHVDTKRSMANIYEEDQQDEEKTNEEQTDE